MYNLEFVILMRLELIIIKNIFFSSGVSFGTHAFQHELFVADTTRNESFFLLPSEKFVLKKKSLNYIALTIGPKILFPVFRNDNFFISGKLKATFYNRENIFLNEDYFSEYRNENINLQYELILNSKSLLLSYEIGIGYALFFGSKENQSIIFGIQNN